MSIGKKIDWWMAVLEQIWKWSRLPPHSGVLCLLHLCMTGQNENGSRVGERFRVSCASILTLNSVGFTPIYFWTWIREYRCIRVCGSIRNYDSQCHGVILGPSADMHSPRWFDVGIFFGGFPLLARWPTEASWSAPQSMWYARKKTSENSCKEYRKH